MPDSPASPSGEINPGTEISDSDFDVDMDVEDYEIAIGNCADDLPRARELLADMPDDVFEEYAELDYPGLPEELRPDYAEAEEEEEEEEEEEL
jgi:hypothetical protein